MTWGGDELSPCGLNTTAGNSDPTSFPGPSPLSKGRGRPTKDRGVFCHMTHDKIAYSKVLFSNRQSCLFSSNLKAFKGNEDILSCFTRQNAPGVLEYFGSIVEMFMSPVRHFERGELEICCNWTLQRSRLHLHLTIHFIPSMECSFTEGLVLMSCPSNCGCTKFKNNQNSTPS